MMWWCHLGKQAGIVTPVDCVGCSICLGYTFLTFVVCDMLLPINELPVSR
jgi:hypothetical protein